MSIPSSNPPGRRRVVITGMGAITPIGSTLEDIWASLRAEKSGIGRITRFDTDFYGVYSAGEINSYVPEKYLPTHRLKRLDRFAQFAVATSKLAIEDAGLDLSPENPTFRVGVSYGTALGGIANAEYEHQKFIEGGPKAVKKTLALQVFGGSAHTNIAIDFGLRGVATTNSNSCASGPVAIGEGLRYIRDGLAEVVVAGAAEAPLSPLTFGAFALIRTMSRLDDPANPGRACRPFDAERDGFVMGEGGATLILEELEHAKARGARIYAELLGYGLNNDAYHMTSPLPGGESATKVMEDALADAGVAPEEIDYINAHASSTQLNDGTETACIKRVFGDHAYKIPVTGTKPYTAHALGATGAFEAIFCVLMMRNRWVAPTLHFATPDPECDLDMVPNHGRDYAMRTVLSNSFGFGGINSAIVLRNWEE
jgi:3-oxoacyl-[acyl-carrier-protein] synthase II